MTDEQKSTESQPLKSTTTKTPNSPCTEMAWCRSAASCGHSSCWPTTAFCHRFCMPAAYCVNSRTRTTTWRWRRLVTPFVWHCVRSAADWFPLSVLPICLTLACPVVEAANGEFVWCFIQFHPSQNRP